MIDRASVDRKTTPQLRVRRSDRRGVQDFGWSMNYLTFSFSDYHDPDWMGYGPLRVLIESHIDPHSGFSEHPHRNVEILSYVTSGTLRHRDSHGHEADVPPGDMQLISAGRREMRHEETNPFDEPESHYQIWLAPNRRDTTFAYHQVGYSADERRGQFRLYASPGGRNESMPVNADALVHAGLFSAGGTAEHQLFDGRGAWLQVVRGTVQLDPAQTEPVTLATGDGAGISNVQHLRMRFPDDCELLLIDVPTRRSSAA